MSTCLGKSSLVVDSAVFNDNARSLYASGFTQINPVEVSGSNFNYTQPMVPAPDSVYMLYLNNSTGFKVQQNEFTGNLNLPSLQYGVIVNNAGTDNNYIYDNTFRQLSYGLQGLNINCNSDASIDGGVPVFIPTGLRFICNKFADVGCESDFLINEDMDDPPTLPGIAYHQRNAANISDPTQEPAGNVFTQGHGNLNDTEYDINISTSVGDILYTHHTSSDPYGLRVKPEDVSNPDKVGYQEKGQTYSEEDCCPDDFFPDGDQSELRSALSETNHFVDSLITLLQLFVDDGSTDTLKSAVDNSLPSQSYEVYQDLLSASPYLSDSVVKSSIEKEDVLPNAMIRDIMVANPKSAKNEELLTALDERADPMPDSLWVEILQGMDTVSAMERLVNELDGCMQRRDLYFNALAELLMKDAINSWAQDSLVSLYLTDNRLSSGYLLALYYLSRFDISFAGAVIQNIPSQFGLTNRQSETYAKMVDLLTILPQSYNETAGYILPDSLQYQILENLAISDYDLPGAWARNILIASDLMTYEEPIFSGSTLKSSRKERYHWTSSHEIFNLLSVFPNPSKDYIIIEYKKNNISDIETIEIWDIQGKKRETLVLSRDMNQFIYPTTNLPSGSYIIQLFVNGKPKETCKFVVIR